MKKILLVGLIIGLFVALPAGAFAWSMHQEAKPLIGFDCSGPYYYTADGKYYADKNGKKIADSAEPIPSQTGTDSRCSGTVYVFDDADNKCYIVKGSNANGISCVKR